MRCTYLLKAATITLYGAWQSSLSCSADVGSDRHEACCTHFKEHSRSLAGGRCTLLVTYYLPEELPQPRLSQQHCKGTSPVWAFHAQAHCLRPSCCLHFNQRFQGFGSLICLMPLCTFKLANTDLVAHDAMEANIFQTWAEFSAGLDYLLCLPTISEFKSLPQQATSLWRICSHLAAWRQPLAQPVPHLLRSVTKYSWPATERCATALPQ